MDRFPCGTGREIVRQVVSKKALTLVGLHPFREGQAYLPLDRTVPSGKIDQ